MKKILDIKWEEGLHAKDTEVLEDDIDKLMEQLRLSYPEFCDEHFAARTIEDLGIRYEKEAGQQPATPQPA